MRLLFLGDTAGTGFGTVTRDLGRELIALGLDVRFLSLNEDESAEPDPEFAARTAVIGQPDGWLGLADKETTRTRLAGMFTGSLFPDGWTPEAGLIIGDVASLKMSPVAEFIVPTVPVYHYVPIEGVGLPPAWAAMWQTFRPVAVSEFGAEQIRLVTGTKPPVVYHGVDTEAFYPVSAARPIVIRSERELIVLRTRDDCRRFLGWPVGDTILFRADRHMPRKNYAAMFRCLAPVLRDDPKVRLVWHARTLDWGGDLRDERSKYPAAIGDRMNSTGLHDRFGGADRKVLAAMYNAADLYVSTSAEGFGLTIAESIACGTPAVGLAYSSVPEVIGPAGVVVPCLLTDNIYSHFWATPVEQAYTEAVRTLLADVAGRQVMGMKGPYHVREHFRWSRAAEQFADIMGAAVREEAIA